MSRPTIHAAGAVVLRSRKARREVLVVHRPRYDDWSLPKGKLERGETDAVCAVREVAEETGVRIHLTAPLSAHRYPVKGETKQVDWWLADAFDGEAGDVTDTEEIDEVAWLDLAAATTRLTYPDERDRLLEAVALPRVTPLLIVRHAKALARKHWDRPDVERPITEWGRRQARALMPFLAAFGVRRVISSSATRCLQTVNPYARALGLKLEGWLDLTEETGERDPEAGRRVLTDLACWVGESHTPTVVCGHRPVLPAMLKGVGVRGHKFATAETVVIALDNSGQPVATRALPQRIGR